jgi:hypothetical protein
MDSQPQCIFVASGNVQAQQVRAFLASAGIASVERGESVRHTHGLTLDGLGAVQILVAEADVEQARLLLEAAESGEFQLADDAGA